MGNLIQELKRRNVYKVATVYMVASWVLLQVADTVFPAFGFSADLFRNLTMALVAGFPLAIILAWLFEFTASGIKRTQEPLNGTAVASSGSDLVVIFLLLVLVGFTARDEFSGFDQTDSNSNAQARPVQVVKSSLNTGMSSPSIATGLYSEIALSPDGSRFVYTSIRNGEIEIYLRMLEEEQSTLIANLGGESLNRIINPVFSKDGESIWYYSGNDLMNMQIVEHSLNNDIVQSRIDSAFGIGISTAEDGSVWYQGPGFAMHRYTLGSDSGPIVVSPFDNLGGKGQTVSLPGGATVLFTTFLSLDAIGKGTTNIHLLDLKSKESKLLIESAHLPRYVSSGHILFMRTNVLWAAAFDLDSLELTGNEYPVLQGVATAGDGTGQTAYSVSENGRLVYLPTDVDSEAALGFNSGIQFSSLNWIDREGVASEIDLSGIPASFSSSKLSPDGRKIAVTSLQRVTESVWIYDIERETISRLTSQSGSSPQWSADGQTIYYGMNGIFSVASNGLGDPIRHYQGRAINIELTPNESHFIFDTSDTVISRRQESSDILMLPTSSRANVDLPTPLISTPFDEQDAAISPDGKWIAYASNRSGRYEVYVQPFPNLDDRWQISSTGGYRPQWTSDGNELVYAEKMDILEANEGSHIMSVEIDASNGFSAETPRTLFVIDRLTFDFTVSTDGSRFLMSSQASAQEIDDLTRPVSFTLIENWFEELKRLAPADLE